MAGPLFLLLALVTYAQALIPSNTFYADVLFRYFLGNAAVLAESLRHFELPFWNPHISAGVPHLANPQTGLFYPATYLFVLFSFSTAIKLHVVLHTVMAGCGMYILSRHVHTERWGSFGAGVIYAFSGFAAFHYQLPSHMQGYALTPWVVACFRRGMDRDTTGRRLAGIATLTLLLCCGYPPFIFYAACLTAALIGPIRRIAWLRQVRFLVIVMATSSAIASIQWLPAADFAAQTTRFNNVNLEWALAKSLRWDDMASMVFLPQWSWYHRFDLDLGVCGFYIGPFVLFLAVRGFLNRSREGLSVSCLALVMMSFLLALGASGGLYPWLLEHVRPFGWFRYPANSLLLACAAIALLAGWGLDRMSLPRSKLFIGLCALDLGLFALGAYKTVAARFYDEVPPTVTFLKANIGSDRFIMTPRSTAMLTRGGATEYDAYVHFLDSLMPNLASAYGLSDAGGGTELQFARHASIYSEIERSGTSPWLDVLSVKYLLSFWPVRDLPVVWRGPSGIFVQRRTSSLPRAYFVPEAECLAPELILRSMSQGALDPRRTVALETGCSALVPALRASAGPSVRFARQSPSRYRVSLTAERPGWIVISESFDRGWTARYNGQAVPLLRANYHQQAVAVKPGLVSLEFEYRPRHWPWAVAISAVGFGTVLLLLAVPVVKRRCKRK